MSFQNTVGIKSLINRNCSSAVNDKHFFHLFINSSAFTFSIQLIQFLEWISFFCSQFLLFHFYYFSCVVIIQIFFYSLHLFLFFLISLYLHLLFNYSFYSAFYCRISCCIVFAYPFLQHIIFVVFLSYLKLGTIVLCWKA